MLAVDIVWNTWGGVGPRLFWLKSAKPKTTLL